MRLSNQKGALISLETLIRIIQSEYFYKFPESHDKYSCLWLYTYIFYMLVQSTIDLAFS